ncbi:leucine-rich repeat-containing G-protein coupled receptor 4-like isoform X1 [Colias croceus]|uniref:leucine-rich repeat-containing G-protein coupled receptor 4-like isoform X1 n=1 Tax=Colias crocea TaxID=72248 RepID=UPI001E27F96A|nr:leucine-rich repeat-containing G-protein coupled receptor 4-like isoform X1 [Colias croceus]
MFALALAAVALCALSSRPGAGASLHCAMRREISPCTCRREDNGTGAIVVVCKSISTYEEIARALTDKFNPETKIVLEVANSQLPDFADHTFRELGLSITRLKLNFDNLSELKESVFTKLDLVEFFSLADNALTEMPRHVFRHLPHVLTLDLCRNKITKLTEEDFKDIQGLEHLLVADNQISKIERHAVPKGLIHVHLGINKLSSLNGALRDLNDLEWIFINANHLKSIDNELPVKAKKLVLIHAAHNELQSLPKDLQQMPSLQSLYFYDNHIKSLDGALQKSRRLMTISLSFNKIEMLAEDDFAEAEILADLDIAYNQLRSLNGSLRSLKSLRYLNLTHNAFTEFSLQEIKGLKRLSVIDLSHNKISFITGNMEILFQNLVDVETRVLELRLDHNNLHNLGGALMGLHGLLRLNLSNNQIQQISPDDLIGLEELRLLDVSYNHITTLEETSKTFLPYLEELIAHHNNITALDKDFHGLPSLCTADLSYNKIQTVNYEVVSKSRCTINGVPSILKIYLQDNPVLCDDRLYELETVLLGLNARLSGDATCAAPQTSAPVLMRALNDIVPDAPVVLVARVAGARLLDGLPQHAYQRVGALGPGVPPAGSNVVVKWPDERPHPLADHLRLRDLKASPQ